MQAPVEITLEAPPTPLMAKAAKGSVQIADQLPAIKDWHALVVIALAVVVFFRDILLGKAYFWEDFMYYYYPARNFAAVSMAGGHLPLWNPYTFNGMPFQADIQTAIFYLPNLFLTLFVSGGRLSLYAFEVEIILHYIVAGVGMYYLAKSFGIEKIFSMFSGLVFALSGFMITRAIHQPMICETAWLPVIVLFFRKALNEHSILAMLLTGLVLGHAILAGFPQLTLYIFFLLLLLYIVHVIGVSRRSGFRAIVPGSLLAGGAVVISLALAAIQLLPTVELAPYTQRAEMSYAKSLDGSLSWGGILTLFIPKLFGANGAQGSTLWAEGAYGQYWETCVYVGIAGLACAIFALPLFRTNPHVRFFSILALCSLLYCLGDSFVLHKMFFNYVPGFNKFREPGRLSFLWTFAAAPLSGFGLQRLFGMAAQQSKNLRNWLIGIAAVGAVIWFAVSQGAFQPSTNPGMYEQIHAIASDAATTSMIILLGFCVLFVLYMRKILSARAALVTLFLIQFVDINVFGFSQNNGLTNPEDYYARPGEMLTRLKEESKHEIFRVNSRSGGAMILDRNQGMLDRIFTMEGYSSLVLQRISPPGKDWPAVRDQMNAKYYIQVDQQRQTMALGQSPTYLPRAYMVYDARKITDDAQQKAFMASDDYHPDKMIVLEVDPPYGPANSADSSVVRGTATITSYEVNDIKVDVSSPANGYLAFSEVYYPGWNAYVDGVLHPVFRSDWNLRAVPVESGHHTVEMRFEPKSFSQGSLMTFSTLVIVLIVGVFAWRRGKSQKPSGMEV